MANVKEKALSYLEKAGELIDPLCDVNLISALETRKEINEAKEKVAKEKETLVVFVGTYTSGKSTIIKRLTGSNLETGINPLTSEVDTIHWGNMLIADTPGLKSNQREHDNLTLSYIGKADIVVWVIEADRLLLENHREIFKKVAVELNKKDRMILVINQMDTTGAVVTDEEEWERIKSNKVEEVNRILKECEIDSNMPIICISADPFAMGSGLDITEALNLWNQSPYMEMSYFDTFIAEFNNFTKKYGHDAKYLGAIDRCSEFLGKIVDDMLKIRDTYGKTNEMNGIVYNSIRDVLSKASLRFNSLKAKNKSELHKLITKEFRDEVLSISQSEDFRKLESQFDEKRIEVIIDCFCSESIEKIIEEFDSYIDTLIENQQNKIEELYLNDEIKNRAAEVEFLFEKRTFSEYMTPNTPNIEASKDNVFEKNKDQVSKFIKDGIKLIPTDPNKYHKLVYYIGKKFGKKFKPYEVSKLGKKVAKAVKALPVVIGVIEIIANMISFFRSSKKVEEMENKKSEILSGINKMEDQIWDYVEEELNGYYASKTDYFKEDIDRIKKDIDEINNQIEFYDGYIQRIRTLKF